MSKNLTFGDRKLTGDKKHFKELIQKNGQFVKEAPKPMFAADLEELSKYVFCGICNSKCPHCATSRQLDLARTTSLSSRWIAWIATR